LAARIQHTPTNNENDSERRRPNADHQPPGSADPSADLPNAGGPCASGPGCLFRRGGFSHLLSLPLLHAVAATIDRNHLRVMKQPIEQCRSKDLIPTEQPSPSSKAGIRRQDDRSMLI